MADSAADFVDHGASDAMEVPVPSNRLPGGLKAICVIAIVLGTLGAIAGLASCVGFVVGEAAQAALQPEVEQDSPVLARLHRESQAEINAIARKYMGLNVAVAIMHLGSGLLLLSGGILALRRRNIGPLLLTFGAVVAIVYEVGQGISAVAIQLHVMPIVESVTAALQAASDLPEQAADKLVVASRLAIIATFVGLAITVVTAVVKIIYYIIVLFYLRKPRVRKIFQMRETDTECI